MGTSVVNTGGFLGTGIMQPLAGWAIDLSQHGSTARTLADYQAGLGIMLGFSAMGLVRGVFHPGNLLPLPATGLNAKNRFCGYALSPVAPLC